MTACDAESTASIEGEENTFPTGHAGAQPDADIAEEHGQVPRPATGDDPDVAVDGCVRPDEGPPIRADGTELIWPGCQEPVDHLVDEGVRVVQDLLHGLPLNGL